MNARRTSAAARIATVPAAKTTISLRRRGVLAVAGTAVVAAASLGVTASAYAKNGNDTKQDVRKSVACGTGLLKLKAKSEDGNRLELEAELDSNQVGQDWTVTLTNDGKTVWTGKRTTAGPSGSFSVETIVDANATEATPTESPTSSTSTTAPTTGDDSSSTTAPTTTDDSSSTTAPTTTDDSSSTTAPTTSDDSSATASPTTADDSSSPATSEDNPGRAGDDHPSLRARSSKGGGDDKPGDDKGGASKPGSGSHLIGVTATYDTLNCATDVTM
jgi:hypothetical protein